MTAPDAESVLKLRDAQHQRRPRATAVVVVSGVLLVGTGVAAATGALSPSAIKQNAQHALTPAGSILGSPDPASVPGAVVRLSTPGPEGTVLQVTSDAGTYNDLAAASCVTITISEPNGSAAPGSQEADKGGCAVVGTSSLDDPLPVGDAVSAGETVTTWSSPSGQSYTIEFGEGPAGTAAVAFTDAQDDVGAKAVAVNGWYAVYIASGLYTSFDNLSFFNDAGQMIGLGH
jgi:hypothetical protein